MLGKWNFPHLYWSREREEFSFWAVSGQTGIPWQPGWKYQQQDVVFVRGQFPVLGPYKHTAIHQTCCPPSSFGWPSLSLSLLPPLCWFIVFYLPLLPNLSSLGIYNILAVVRDPGQSDRVLRFDAPPRCSLSRWEGQAGVGEGARGGKEEGPQTHWDSKTKILIFWSFFDLFWS